MPIAPDQILDTIPKKRVSVSVENGPKPGNATVTISCDIGIGNFSVPKILQRSGKITIDLHFGIYHQYYEQSGYPIFWKFKKATFHYVIDKSFDIKRVKVTRDISSDAKILKLNIRGLNNAEAMQRDKNLVTFKNEANNNYDFQNLSSVIESCEDLVLDVEETYANGKL